MSKKMISIPEQEFPQYMADQISRIWEELIKSKARTDAFRHIIDALVATHPNPRALSNILAAVRPELVDELVPDVSDDDLRTVQLEAWADELKHIDEVVKVVIAELHGDGSNEEN